MSTELKPWVEPDPPDVDVIDKALVMLPLDAVTVYPEVATWAPQTLGAAEWAMVRLARAAADYDEIEVEASASIKRIVAWKRDAQRHAAREVDFFSAGLERYGRARREQTGAATTKLPSGEIKTQWVDDRIIVDDPDALVLWLDGNEYEDAIKTVRTPLVSKLAGYGVRIGKQVVGYRAVLDDGSWVETHGADEAPWSVGEILDGRPVIKVESVEQAQVLDNEGRPVPGCSVEAGHVRAGATPSQTPRAGVTSDRQSPLLNN